jgi:hypothetical protein
MKTISRNEARAKTVGNILASLRIEQLTPSVSVIMAMNACMTGEASTTKVLAGVIRQHVPLRRD